MRKKLVNIGRTGIAGICVTGMLGWATTSNAQQESVDAARFEVVVFSNSTGGSELVSGDVGAAIEKIEHSKTLEPSDAKDYGFCAAYTIVGEFSSAEKHCRAAIRLSSAHVSALNTPSTRAAWRELEAVALNNLGVLFALQGEEDKALRYFRAANRKSPHLSDVSSRNIDALELQADNIEVAGRA